MEISIKKVGIIISILAVIILALVGCFCVANVNDNKNNSVKGNNDTMTTASSDFILQGDFAQMQDIWNSAVEESIKYGKNIKVALGNNWNSKYEGADKIFGEGKGFSEGRILIPRGAEITLDLADKVIEKYAGEDTMYSNGSVFLVHGVLNVIDSGYDGDLIAETCENNKSNKQTLCDALDRVNKNKSKIRGGRSSIGGGCFYISNGGKLNIYGGLICDNTAQSKGGAIFVGDESFCNIYGGLFYYNRSIGDAGAVMSNGTTTINGGYFVNNSANFGGAVYSGTLLTSYVSFNNATFVYNWANGSGGASYVHMGSADFNKCTFYGNSAIGNGGAVSMLSVGEVAIKDCIFTKNTANKSAAIGINGTSGGRFSLTSNKIYENEATTAGGGINLEGTNSVKLQGAVQVFNNTAGGASSDIELKNQAIIEVVGYLYSSSATSYIGIKLASDYGNVPFTHGYTYYKNSIDPSKIFFSNNTNFPIVKSGDEAVLGTTGNKPTESCEWVLTSHKGEVIKTTGSYLDVTYNGGQYTLTNSKGSFYRASSGTALTTYDSIKNVGSIAFYTNANVKNPTLTIKILPKEVELEWINTSLTYNGASQIPIATIKASDLVAGDECTVTVSGAQTLAGNYIATAKSLSNGNYKIKSTSKNYVDFTIAKANLTIDVTTKNISKEYNGKIVDIGNDWYNITTNGLLGVDRGKAIDKLFNIDTKAFVPQFNGNESVVEVGEYIISTKPFTVSEVFKDNLNYNVNINYVNTGKLTITNPSVIRPTDNSGYDFMMLQNNKRVSYKEKELIHGDNDSEYTNFVLGNIAPNTSVQTLLNNLVFSDMSQVQIYNGANEVVYGENAKAFYTANIENGTELAVGTGWYIRYEKLTGGEETIYLSVLGDLTGDGKVNSADVNRLRQMVNNIEVYTNSNEVVKLSSLIINNGKTPTNADAEIVWNVVCGKIDIADFI